jgi:hypothetical protein
MVIVRDGEAKTTPRVVRTATPLRDALTKRDAATGRLIEIRTAHGVSRATAPSEHAVKDASSRRHAALKRLADR